MIVRDFFWGGGLLLTTESDFFLIFHETFNIIARIQEMVHHKYIQESKLFL